MGVGLSVEQHLVSGERELARCREFQLTERRLLKYGKGGQVRFLTINSITTLSNITTYIKSAVIIGGILVVVGIVTKLFAIMGDALSAGMSGFLEEYNPPNYSATVDPIFLPLLVVGIVAIVVGIAFKRDWYQISAAGLTGEDTKVWRIPRDGSIESRNFIRMLERRIAGEELESKT